MDHDFRKKWKSKNKRATWMRDLKVTGTKEELAAWVFAPSENGVHPVKPALELESDLADGFKNLSFRNLTH